MNNSIPTSYMSIRLTQLCKLLDMIQQYSNLGNIIIDLDCTKYHYTMLNGEIKQVMVEDIAFDKVSNELVLYCNTEHNPDVTEAEFDERGNFAVYKFFNIMYYALDHRRNVFTPDIIVKCPRSEHLYNGLPDRINPFMYPLYYNIKKIQVMPSHTCTVTCTFVIYTDNGSEKK